MTTLRPIIRQKLYEFRRRRNLLLAIKGLSAAAIVTILVGLVCVVIDLRWSLSMPARWIIAIATYAAAAIAIGLVAIGPGLRGRSLAWLAGMLEQKEPRLKDRLLAAIELSSDCSPSCVGRSPGSIDPATMDSAAFRNAVQRSAAKRIESIRIAEVLPWRLVQVWMWMGGLVVGVVTALCFVPDIYLANRLGRILLPMANIGRVSQYAIEIIQPLPTNDSFPEGNTVAVKAKVHGGTPSAVVFESESISSGDQQIHSMHFDSGEGTEQIFQMHWTPSLGNTRYRVVADDASTAWYQIDVRPRPKVEQFVIEYRYPEYALEPNKLIENEAGDLEAVSGTIASVSIVPNQKILEGQLRIQLKDRSLETEPSDHRIPLNRSEDGHWTAKVLIDRDASYRVDLVASDTKFANTFSPKYTIHAIQDQPPAIRWLNPVESSLVVRAGQLIDLSAELVDEFPVVSLTQQIKSGSSDWTDRAIPIGEISNQKLDFTLDLSPLNAKPGDVVQTRLVAVDRKRQSTISTVIEFVVSSMSLDPDRQTKMRDRIELAKQIDAFHTKLEEHAKSTQAMREEWKKQPKDSSLTQQLTDSIQDFGNMAQHESSVLRRKIVETLSRIDDSVSATELELLAQRLARIETEDLALLDLNIQLAADQPDDPKILQASSEQIDKLVKSTSQISRHSRDFVSHDVLSQVGMDLSVLLNYQQELKNSIPEILPEQYRRRQMLVARQMQDLSALIREHLSVFQNRSERTARQWSEWLDNQARKIHDITGKEGKSLPAQEKLADREQLANQIEQELQQHQNSGNIDSGSPQAQLKARKEIRDQVANSARTIERLAQSLRQLNQPKRAEEAEKEITQQLLPALERLSMDRELQQARHDGDNQFIADLGEAYRAVQLAIQDRHQDPQSTTIKLEAIHKSMKTLEAIHDLQEASQTLEQLHSTERWKASSLEARFEQPRVWDAYRQQLSNAAQSLASAKIPRSTIAALDSLQKNEAFQRADSKIGPRRWTSSNTASAAQDIEELQSELRATMTALTAIASEARQTLTEYTPKITDLAKKAAENVRRGSEDTKRLSQAMAADEVPDIAPRLEQLKQSIESNEPELEQLREALADVASRQDLMQHKNAQIARDADASIAITRDLEKRIEMSLEEAASAEDDEAARLQLDHSATTQDQAATSLDRIANHFEAMENTKDSSMTVAADSSAMPSEIEKASKEIARQPEMDRAHADAERLRRLASLDPKLVLEQLEKELDRSKAMRVELSSIAEDAVESALQTLEFTADREQAMVVGLENSDLDFSNRKEAMQADIKRLSDLARHISNNLATRTQSTADQAQLPEVRKNVQRLKNSLDRAIQTAEAIRADDLNVSMDRILDAADELKTQLEYFHRGMARQAIALGSASEAQSAMNENQRRDRKRALEDLQSRFREEDVRQAFAHERDRQQETQRAEQDRKKANQIVDQQKRELAEAERQAAKEGVTDVWKQTITSRQSQVSFAEANQRWAELVRTAAESRQSAARLAREQRQMAELKPLDAPNPVAQLSSRTALAASLAAQAAVEDLQKSIGEYQQNEPPKAAIQALTDATVEQEGLKKGIVDAAEALARSARHEARLDKPEIDAMLQLQADQVAAIARGSMQQAYEHLEMTSRQESQSTPNHINQASSDATLQSQQLLRLAEQALREQAASLRSNANREQTPSNTNETASDGSTAAKQDSGLLSPQEMAQMLDELDQKLNAEPKDADSQGQTSSQQNATKSSSSQSGKQSKSGAPGEPSEAGPDERAQTLADAAQRLASEMNQQRQAMESSAKSMPETGAPDSQSRSATQPGKSSSGIVMPVEIDNIEDWGKLREQSAEKALEGDREQILPAYRKQIEEYFRVLSKRQLSK